MILTKHTRRAICSKLLLDCRYYSSKASLYNHRLVSECFLLRAIVPRIFIADQRIQGISFALDLLRDTEPAHTERGFMLRAE